jgi:hypothetical protein
MQPQGRGRREYTACWFSHSHAIPLPCNQGSHPHISTQRSCFSTSANCLQDFFGGREPGRALNSEECIAKGCALAAAIISPTFKVRDFSVIDAFVFPINLSWATHAAATDADAMDTGAADAASEKKGDGDIFKQYGPLPVTCGSPPLQCPSPHVHTDISSPSTAASRSISTLRMVKVC